MEQTVFYQEVSVCCFSPFTVFAWRWQSAPFVLPGAALVMGLMALGGGVIVGAAPSIRVIRTALQKHRAAMIWFILGLMPGSLYAIIMGPASL